MESNSNAIHIPKFEYGSDYEYQNIQMKTFLKGRSYWDIVEDGYNDHVDWSTLSTDAKEKENQNSIDLSFIQETLDKSIFSKISTYIST